MIIGDNNKNSVCITDKYDTISSYYKQILYDPRIDSPDSSSLLTCDNKTIWMSKDTKYIIYYQQFTDSDIDISFISQSDDNKDNTSPIGGFGIFECGIDSYLSALKQQSADIPSSKLCVNPGSVFPDSYPNCQCQSKPLIYCLPFKEKSKCPQFQGTMTSMYNKIDIDNDLYKSTEIDNFYDCNCWYKADSEGDINNDQQINLVMDFNEDCQEKQEQERMKQADKEQDILQDLARRHNEENERRRNEEKQEDEEYEDEIELEKHKEFTILWATLGFIIGVIVLIIIVIYSCRKQYDKKMYLTSRKYYRNAHYGEIENDNLMELSESETDSEFSTGSYEDDDGSGSTLSDEDDSNLSEELAYEDGTTTNYSESTIANNTDNTTLKI